MPVFPLLALSGLIFVACASTPSEEPPPTPPDEGAAKAACAEWELDIVNHTGLELQVYVFRGDTAVAPSRRNRGHLVRFVGPRLRASTLLSGAQPAVMIYAFQQAANAQFQVVVDSAGNASYEQVAPDRPERTWFLEVAAPDRERLAWQARRVGLSFACVARRDDLEEPPSLPDEGVL